MGTDRRGIALTFAVALTCIAASLAAQQAPTRIPEVHGTTFAGKAVNLPEDLHGRATILVIGFTQDSRAPVTAWGKRLADDYFESPTVAYFEMPMLESVPRIMRGFVLNRIKSSVSDRGRTTFLPLLDHEAEWKIAIGYAKADDAYIVLLDEHGLVRWRTHGPITDEAYADLKSHIKEARPAH